MFFEVRVPLVPGKCASPNGRCHHMEKAGEVAELRRAGGYATADMMARLGPGGVRQARACEGALAVRLEIAWPKGRKRLDTDNAVGSCKAILDGVLDYAGIDDARVGAVEVEQRVDVQGDESGVRVTVAAALGA